MRTTQNRGEKERGEQEECAAIQKLVAHVFPFWNNKKEIIANSVEKKREQQNMRTACG